MRLTARRLHISAALLLMLTLGVFMTLGATVASAKLTAQLKGKGATSIDFVDRTHGFALVYNTSDYKYKLAYTANGGKKWRLRNLPANLDIDFVTTKIGWCTGSDGKIYKTSDAGKTWTAQASGQTASLYNVCFVNKKAGWACGNDGMSWVIVRTTNGGATWTLVKSGNDGYLQALSFSDSTHGVCGGATFSPVFKGRILSTSDGGATWKEALVESTKFKNAEMVDKKNGWIGGYEASVTYRTKNGGTTWTKAKVGKSESLGNDINGIAFTDKNHGWIVAGSRLFTTTNAGKTWKTTRLFKSDGASCLAVVNRKNIWIGSYKGIWKLK